jgi:hypothetical protein
MLGQLAVEDPVTTELPPEQPPRPTPLPQVEDVPETELPHETPAVRPAPAHLWRVVLLVVVLIGAAVFIFDILLDSGVLTSTSIPHTHFFGI